jgi:hypothetical protein
MGVRWMGVRKKKILCEHYSFVKKSLKAVFAVIELTQKAIL